MEQKKGKNKKLHFIFWLVVIVTLLIVVYIFVNPRWEAAKLTIEPADRDFEILCIHPEGNTLEERIVPPEGYTRVKVDDGSFGEYLRQYPLLADDIKLPVFDGSTIKSKDVAAVFDISLGDEGYQQCADSVIRLYSDYFYQSKQYDKISFQFSNGRECNYNRWRKGMRILAYGSFALEIPGALPDDSEQQYRNYLKEVMRYAGTISLRKESEEISVDELKIGDIIFNDYHVVMIVDEAVNEDGEKCYLIGQSFIPAVCFHILTTKTDEGEVTPWITREQLSTDTFQISIYEFEKEGICRWKEGF